MAGLLDMLSSNASPEQSDQAMGLAAGLLSANGSQGLSAGILGMNAARMDALKRQDLAQQIQLRNIGLQQQQQEWALQLPMLKAMAERMNGGGQGAQSPQLSQPSQPAIAPTGGGALGSGTFGLPLGGQDASAPQRPTQTGSTMGGSTMFPGVPDNVAYPTAAFGGFKAVLPLMSKYNEPTELMKTMAASGLQPGSPEWNQTLQANIKKLNNIPLQAGRAGAPMYNGDGSIAAMAPKIPDNAIPQIVGGQVVGVAPLPGAANVAQINSYAGAAGKNQAEPMPAFRGNQPVFTNKLAAATGAPSIGAVAPQPGMTGQFVGNPADVIEGIRKIADPQEQANAFDAFTKQMRATGGNLPAPSGEVTPGPQLGAKEGAVLSQDELGKKGASLMADNSNTNTVISRLQNIKMLAPGAITGAETGRRDFMNGLLSLAGIKAADDAKTASDLVEKNSAQIVSALRMGQGGAGTDALQSLLGSANPNRHMTKEAIMEAADQLIASQKMVQAKAQLLQPHYLGRDPVAYGANELKFDQNADPRVWQLQAMTPQQQSTYVKTLPADVAADMLKKRQALKQLGALK